MLESGLFTSKINIGLESGIYAETPRDNGECQAASVRSRNIGRLGGQAVGHMAEIRWSTG